MSWRPRPGSSEVPLSQRPWDWFFVVMFSFFAFSSFFSDAWHGLNAIDATSFWGRANLWYIQVAGDEFMRADNTFSRLNTAISGLIYGPFYLTLVYAFVRGKGWIRIPAFVYVGAMLHGYVEFMWWEYALGTPPLHPLVFWAFNGPYGGACAAGDSHVEGAPVCDGRRAHHSRVRASAGHGGLGSARLSGAGRA